MAIGKSHRIVIEIEPETKAKIYDALKARGLNLKEWFVDQVERDLLRGAGTKKKGKKSERA